ncbi:MAG TPA: Ig-like domain-containing protein, partial [candidate division Zixibacteria bacterium]|nr:Ig-like domain-containing protein [candidate division Zixibacteria bacterium]
MNLLASDRQLSRPALTATLAVAWLLIGGALAQANTPPSIGALGDRYLAEGQTLKLTVGAVDADGDPLSLSLGVRPQGAVVTDHGDGSASVSWSAAYLGPNSAAGSPFTLEVIASDGLSASSQSLKIFVQNVNRAPSIVAPDTIFVEAGDTVAFQATGADPDLDPVFWTSSALPDGARLESVSGGSVADFRWAPSASDSGMTTVTFIARDIYGLADSAQSTMVVSVGDPYTVSIARDTVFPGEVVSLPVYLKNRAPVSGFSFVMHYDPSVMAILSVTTAGARAGSFESLLYLKDVPAPGDLRVSGQR